MAIQDAQGLSVTFDGVRAVNVVSCNQSGGDAGLIDMTPLDAAVLGSGNWARVVKGVLPASVEPVTFSITMLGIGLNVSADDRGKVANLSINQPGIVNYSGDAVLLSNSVTMAAGEIPQQTLSFSFLY
jgi:hypothetical protein